MFNHQITLVFIVQFISLLANNILYFCLSLHILDISMSATVFGLSTAFSILPTIIFLPIGGAIIDRYDKRNIMIIVNLFLLLFSLLSIFLIQIRDSVLLATIFLLSLSLIEIFFTPCIQASIPFLQKEQYLIKTNSLSNQIALFTNICGPLLGGILYSFTGIKITLILSCICFALSAFITLYIRIPNNPQVKDTNRNASTLKQDLKEALHFILHQKNILCLLLLSVLINFTIVPFITLGLPVIIKLRFAMKNEIYGLASSLLSLAAIIGGFVTTLFGDKIKSNHLYWMLLIISFTFLPVILFSVVIKNSYSLLIILIACLMIEQFTNNIFSTTLCSLIQINTPGHMIGKVMTFIIMLSICSDPLSRVLYGPIFENTNLNLILLMTLVSIPVLAFTLLYKKEIYSIKWQNHTN